MATVLVTGVGGATGIGAVRALSEETSHEIIGVDMNPDAAGLYFADTGRTVPAAVDDNWADELITLIKNFDVDVVIPTVDEELDQLPKLTSSLLDRRSVIAPRQEVIDISLDKYKSYTFLKNEGHNVPQTWLGTDVNQIDSADYPLLVKPRSGRGSRGIEVLENRKDLESHRDRTEFAAEELLYQEVISGAEYTTSVISTKDNQLLGIVPKEAIKKEGITVKGATRQNSVITESCRSIFETLRPAGPMNVQQIIDEHGDPYIIEINPRFSSTSNLTVAAGVNEFDLLLRDAVGESVSRINDYETDLHILRYDDQLFLPEEKLLS